jgi:2-methylisocitrate lyase-like PEP mutase family enzyme
MERTTTTLRRLLARPKLLLAPGVADSMNARIVCKEGFEVLYMTGGGTAATRLGLPDVGLLTMPEMVDNAQRIAEAAEDIPLIADADNGYGGVVNVRRTIRAYERAGVAAVHLEDQQWPKRCGHMAGKSLVPTEEMVAKIKAAVDSRHDADFVVIARTDAYSVEGYDAALERAARYIEAGADMIFVEELRTIEQLAEVPRRFKVPALYNMASSGKTPFLPAEEIEQLGFRVVIYPNLIMRAQIHAAQTVLRALKSTGDMKPVLDKLSGWEERYELLRLPEIQAFEARYGVDEKLRVGLES